MKAAYLHGLESMIRETDPKMILMRKEFSEVYAPQINYRDDNILSKLLEDINNLKPDLIIGSSMGGYAAYLIGSALNIPTLLFNPAVVSRSFEPSGAMDREFVGTANIVYLGDNDTVINGNMVRKYFHGQAKGTFSYHSYSGTHRVSIDAFTSGVEQAKSYQMSVPGEDVNENEKNLYFKQQSMNPYPVYEYSSIVYEKGFIKGYNESTRWHAEQNTINKIIK